MLRLYRRHRKTCPQTSERYRRCACPIYVEGTVGGESIRKSLDLTSWTAATNVIAKWNTAGKIGQVRSEVPTIAEAIEKFLDDARARGLKDATLRSYTNTLRNRLLAICARKGIRELRDLTVSDLRDVRSAWTLAASTQRMALEQIRAFMRFCEESEWIAKNPATRVKGPKVEQKPTLPLEDADVEKLLMACKTYRGDGERLRALILLMRYSGLRISDAVSLRRDRIQSDRLFLYQQKTGTPVNVPLPRFVIDAVLAASGPEYVFWSGKGKLGSALDDWARAFKSLSKLAGVESFHFHRLRDSFAVSLLEQGVDIEAVAVLLGHASSAVTRKHYNPWVRSRQIALEAAVRKAWTEKGAA
ncbi:MAG: tyrosine-type recombinase/integrase [Vicinamibacterales bacterium]